MMLSSEIRSRFLAYFKRQGHVVVESASLVPSHDPSLLFTNAGMVPFKDVFLGKKSLPYTRAVSSQRCIRAGGKHNDLENVGFTARHHTFFEMLGNFSFGDYFKKEAIHFAWEFVTQELKLDPKDLHVTVFHEDEEAARIWQEQEKVPGERIHRFGEKDNFWSMGDTGPCGPCSEIFIDRGPQYGCKKSACAMGCSCDRFLEFWNLVFMQYERSSEGELMALPRPSVDTGAGLERLAAILQGVATNYDTDLFQPFLRKLSELAPLSAESPFAMRVVADHVRAICFLISDGVFPSHEGRGYVLRRVMRRAIRYGKQLGFERPFLHQTIAWVCDQFEGIYPELRKQQAVIEHAVFLEEEQFLKTLVKGLVLLEEKLAIAGDVLSGEVAFQLYDTYGFPFDLTRMICQERGWSVDESGFDRCMDRQKKTSQKHWRGSGQKILDGYGVFGATSIFVGYDAWQVRSECLQILSEQKSLSSVEADGSTIVQVIFAETPFYPESGGQVADCGRISGEGFEAEVVDVQKVRGCILIHAKLLEGVLRVGSTYFQCTDRALREKTARNHTATHLLHWALREVLGVHLRQAGSLVTPDFLRFDFSHPEPLTQAQWIEVEDLIQKKIFASEPVAKQEMAKEEAMRLGAIAFFEEKYGDQVRVVQVGDFSSEFCGGTHVDTTSQIHLFKIVSEHSVAAGVRRIVAYTSEMAFEYLREKCFQFNALKEQWKAGSNEELFGKFEKFQASERELRKVSEQWRLEKLLLQVPELMKRIQNRGKFQVLVSECQAQDVLELRKLSDALKQRVSDVILVLGARGDGEVFLLIASGKRVPVGFQAQQLLKLLLDPIEGRGGGRSDLAQGVGKCPEGLSQALVEATRWFQEKSSAC